MTETKNPAACVPVLEADPATKLVLAVDDDPDTKLMLETMIRTQGFRVQTAANGKEALLRVEAETPDLIIMDLMMPVLGGYEALLAVHSLTNRRVPVIIHTARLLKESTIEQMRSEADVIGIAKKPVNFPQLFELMHSTLRTRRKETPA